MHHGTSYFAISVNAYEDKVRISNAEYHRRVEAVRASKHSVAYKAAYPTRGEAEKAMKKMKFPFALMVEERIPIYGLF